ncbi:class II fructose-bisphosphate aldolase [Candidatus Saccharibacteria bacterium]|nr:class II fructose-bisphosphate aldolase [Candidatus Saccharibacteria bacterium]
MTIQEIRERTNQARELMQRARTEQFAVGAFNVDDQQTLRAIATAAKNLNSPVLVELTHDEVQAIGIKNMRDMVNNYRAELGIEIYLNLDHSPTVETCRRAIDAGFEFIHIDISQADHDASDETIIAATREVVEYARTTGAIVESEPHYFGGSSNLHSEEIDYEEIKKTFSTPEGAARFVADTGIETFAAAVGNLHGKYPVPKILDLELLRQIRQAIDCNISLHGGSGTPREYFEQAARIGVSKININSDLRFAYRTTLEKVLRENPGQYAVVKLMGAVRDAVQTVVEEKISALGSAGKAML